MGRLIQDVIPFRKQNFDTKQHTSTKRIVSTEVLVTTLYIRGVSIKDIFGMYYALDEQATTPTITVEEARLAGYGTPEIDHKQPF